MKHGFDVLSSNVYGVDTNTNINSTTYFRIQLQEINTIHVAAYTDIDIISNRGLIVFVFVVM